MTFDLEIKINFQIKIPLFNTIHPHFGNHTHKNVVCRLSLELV